MPGGAHEHMKAWEPEEDHIIMDLHAREGPKWKSIVKQLPGRTVCPAFSLRSVAAAWRGR